MEASHWRAGEPKDGFWLLRGPLPGLRQKDERWMATSNLKNRATVGRLWRAGWSETSSFCPLLSFHDSRSVSSSVSLQLFRAGLVSHTALLFRPLTSYVSLFFLLLFSSSFLPSPFFFPLILHFSYYRISWSICTFQVFGWTDKHWLSAGGERGRNIREEWGSERAVSYFHVVAVDCHSVWALSVEVSHLPQWQYRSLCRLGSFLFLLFCIFSWYSKWTTTPLPSPFCVSKMSTYSFYKTHLAHILSHWCVHWRKCGYMEYSIKMKNLLSLHLSNPLFWHKKHKVGLD